MSKSSELIDIFNDPDSWDVSNSIKECPACHRKSFLSDRKTKKCELCNFYLTEKKIDNHVLSDIIKNDTIVIDSPAMFFEKILLLDFIDHSNIRYHDMTFYTKIIPLLSFSDDHLLSHTIRDLTYKLLLQCNESVIPHIIKDCDVDSFYSLANTILLFYYITSDFPYYKAFYYTAYYNGKNDVLHFFADKGLQKLKPMPLSQERLLFKFLENEENKKSVTFDYHFFSTLLTIERIFTLNMLQQLYKTILYQFFDKTWFDYKGDFSPGKIKKNELEMCLLLFINSPVLISHYFNTLNDNEKKLIHHLLYTRKTESEKTVSQRFGIHAIAALQSGYTNKIMINDIYNFTSLLQFNIMFEHNSYQEIIGMRMNDFIADELTRILPVPPHYQLENITDEMLAVAPENIISFRDNGKILNKIISAVEFIDQGHVQFLKNNKGIKKQSLQDFKKYLLLDEMPFGNENSTLRSELILSTLLKQKNAIDKNKDIKELYKSLFFPFTTEIDYCALFIPHITLMYYPDTSTINSEWFTNVLLALKATRGMKRVSFQSFMSKIIREKINISLVNKNFLYHYTRLKNDFRISYYNEPINDDTYFSYYIEPLLKGMMYVLAAFGIIDIEITKELSMNNLTGEKIILTPYINLDYFNLSQFGEYFLFDDASDNFSITDNETNITLDEKSLLLYVDGDDPLLLSGIHNIAEKVFDNCYLVTMKSFLSKCKTQSDYKQTISWFSNFISATPPEIWRDFLKKTSNRVNPLEQVEGYIVLKVKDLPELRDVILNTKAIRDIILKADDFHLLVKTNEYAKLKNILGKEGFVI
ncbi:MAG: hypothetical protein A2015_11325 [Spirochaetes bacterium GWF1_31_7]|nr:MAG: hypothetical protein A2Y30_02560 [Spirochaetes bacterium GWE1_32_154]OHD46824.1 MAG: hypothetical protein A2Y29_09825 [Spirochaetes bacterium GWE2_31_10]OHD47789.1 MAG: hypothetical protein A2015_11325 [Spirochaetes bacterium GWF1_31_7]HBD95644.1 hypothetical protein [Spirochaetia bacterium]HBI37444.1 hypothetical protein [Spirochaetia bacterium]